MCVWGGGGGGRVIGGGRGGGGGNANARARMCFESLMLVYVR